MVNKPTFHMNHCRVYNRKEIAIDYKKKHWSQDTAIHNIFFVLLFKYELSCLIYLIF